MSSGYPEGYMCAYRPKSVIAQQCDRQRLLLNVVDCRSIYPAD